MLAEFRTEGLGGQWTEVTGLYHYNGGAFLDEGLIEQTCAVSEALSLQVAMIMQGGNKPHRLCPGPRGAEPQLESLHSPALDHPRTDHDTLGGAGATP